MQPNSLGQMSRSLVVSIHPHVQCHLHGPLCSRHSSDFSPGVTGIDGVRTIWDIEWVSEITFLSSRYLFPLFSFIFERYTGIFSHVFLFIYSFNSFSHSFPFISPPSHSRITHQTKTKTLHSQS
jgi:hypothetical protein